jgi:hypothetical protein
MDKGARAPITASVSRLFTPTSSGSIQDEHADLKRTEVAPWQPSH